MRRAKVTVKCKQCKCEFEARVADRKRGWGRYCSKSCKAKKQEARTGNYRNYAGNNYRGSGVDRETYQHYQDEYGGIPQFSSGGYYEGSVVGPFDNSTKHQNSGYND